MRAKDDTLAATMERMNAMLSWWGMPNAGGGLIDGQMKRLRQFASELEKTCGDAYSGQMEALLSGNDRFSRSLQELMRSRRPQEVLAIESEIVAALIEGAAQQTERWVETTRKLMGHCAAMAHDAAEELRRQGQEAPAAGPAVLVEPEPPAPPKPVRRQPAPA